MMERTIYVCPLNCGWWEGDAHGHRPLPHGCRLAQLGGVVDMRPLVVVPKEELSKLGITVRFREALARLGRAHHTRKRYL